MPDPRPSPSLGVFNNNQILDELHRRIFNQAIRLELMTTGEGYAQIRLATGKQGTHYSFEAMAYPAPIAVDVHLQDPSPRRAHHVDL